jgi:hypothetical protein
LLTNRLRGISVEEFGLGLRYFNDTVYRGETARALGLPELGPGGYVLALLPSPIANF